jgi:hypothetical protein
LKSRARFGIGGLRTSPLWSESNLAQGFYIETPQLAKDGVEDDPEVAYDLERLRQDTQDLQNLNRLTTLNGRSTHFPRGRI